MADGASAWRAWRDSDARVLRQTGQTLLFGPQAATQRLGHELRRRGLVRLLVLASTRAAPVLEPVLAGACAHADLVETVVGMPAHSPVAHSEELARRYADASFQAVVSVGGGSTSDTAKAVALLLGCGGRLADWWGARPPGTATGSGELAPLPVIAVPTTLSGAELTAGAGALDGNTKQILFFPELRAQVCAYDHDVLGATDPAVLTSTGMNALAHCAEALYSPEANPFVTALSVAGARNLGEGLRALAAGSAAAPELLAAGAALGGLAAASTRVALHHAICHALGSVARVAHGEANAVMLRHVLEFNAPHTRQGQRMLASALASPALPAAEAVHRLALQIGAPCRLADIGVARDALDEAAHRTMSDPGTAFNPRPSTTADVRALLSRAY